MFTGYVWVCLLLLDGDLLRCSLMDSTLDGLIRLEHIVLDGWNGYP